MSAKDSEASGSFLANPHAWLALVTLAGGLWLVSNKLTSNRPVAPVGSSKGFISDQNVEARLWEDPFKYFTPEDGPTAKANRPISNLEILIPQIAQRARQAKGGVVLLPVMLPGGQYSEDKEARIRSRFAIISALGAADYAADESERIGAATTAWPAQRQLAEALQKLPGNAHLDRLWTSTSPDKKKQLVGVFAGPDKNLSTMDVRYEWYHQRTFAPGSATKDRPAVLVLWLDDTYFEDEPLLRLPLLLEPLLENFPAGSDLAVPPVRLIGPRRSSTLRAMLPKWDTKTDTLAKFPSPEIARVAKRVLGQIDVYTATASAMDEVLVQASGNTNALPRALVKDLLVRQGFHAVYNFAATDAQLAREIYEELELRGASLKDKENHVALIHEWDTFYGRMLSLTYAAQVATGQDPATGSSAAYVDGEIHALEGKARAPENFHSFMYLRGLDGQTIGADGAGKEASGEGSRKSSRPASLEELTRWSPDINKAEGQAQFDYLGRLGDRMEQLQQKLRLDDGGGRLKAIGIVGSDVYDTLLILQALRQRFPNVLFFTTDLDVRFLHPSEREWTRNLIVASAYGLQLHPTLQGPVAPFRDSTQTAQFAATLAAFGAPGLGELKSIPPRRFEIGNGVAVDLSVRSNDPFPGQLSSLHPDELRRLHPLTTSQRDHRISGRMFWSFATGILALLGASLMWDKLRRLTWDGWSYPGQALEFSEEDIGGPEGAAMLLGQLPDHAGNPVAAWLQRAPGLADIDTDLVQAPASNASGLNWAREDALAELTRCFVGRLNACFPPANGRDHDSKNLEEVLLRKRITHDACVNLGKDRPTWAFWRPTHAVREREHVRLFLDAFLDRVKAPAPPEQQETGEQRVAVKAAEAPRMATMPLLTSEASSKTTTVSPPTIELPPPSPPAPPTPTARVVKISTPPPPPAKAIGRKVEETLDQSVVRAARSARQSARDIYQLRWRRLAGFWLSVAFSVLAATALALVIWYNAFHDPAGEPFSLSNGTSAWPAQIVRLSVFLAAVCITVGLVRKRLECLSGLTRAFRFAPPEGPAAGNRASAEVLWFAFLDECASPRRWGTIVGGLVLYIAALSALYKAQGEEILNPVRGNLMTVLNSALIFVSVLGLLLLASLTIDASLRCRDFIKQLSENPTEYPKATRQHFSRKHGRIDEHYIDEWMDLQLIAELTEGVGRLVYYPAGLILLLLLARNSWWDAWSWPESLIVAFVLNFILALASVVILQRAAQDAKRQAEESMETKVKQLKAQTAPSKTENNAAQAEKVLEDMRQLQRGAFVPFWENPVVGAVFLSSGGTTMLQVLIWFMNR